MPVQFCPSTSDPGHNEGVLTPRLPTRPPVILAFIFYSSRFSNSFPRVYPRTNIELVSVQHFSYILSKGKNAKLANGSAATLFQLLDLPLDTASHFLPKLLNTSQSSVSSST